MTRWPAAVLIASIAFALIACLGCESAPDASAESGSTCARMSEGNDAQCASVMEGCSQDCLRGKDKTEPNAHEGEGCPKSECTCSQKDTESCAEAHAAVAGEGGHGCAKSECTCPHKSEEACAKAHAAAKGSDAAEAHPGCPHAQAAGSQ